MQNAQTAPVAFRVHVAPCRSWAFPVARRYHPFLPSLCNCLTLGLVGSILL